MPINVWQQLFDAVRVRLSTIHINNGYETSIGTHCFPWRDLNKSPWTISEMPGFTYRDPMRTYAPDTVPLNKHGFVLDLEVMAATAADNSSPVDSHARRIVADIHKAIGVDRRWDSLAEDTLPVSDELQTEHLGDRIVGVTCKFQIVFRTQRFNPYEQ